MKQGLNAMRHLPGAILSCILVIEGTDVSFLKLSLQFSHKSHTGIPFLKGWGNVG